MIYGEEYHSSSFSKLEKIQNNVLIGLFILTTLLAGIFYRKVKNKEE